MRVLAGILSALVLACSNGVGEVCADNQPCVHALRCVYPTADAALGVCDYPLRRFGEACSRAEECEADLTCSSHFTSGQRYGTCVHRHGAGEPCAVNRDCLSDVCDLSAICVGP